MILVQSINNVAAMLEMYRRVISAPEVEIRGMKCRNVSNMAIVMDGRIPPITSFHDRELNLDYAKKEWLWYLGADPSDDSIEEHAKMWAKIKQDDGTYYSNYGQYIFGSNRSDVETQFHYVIETLKADMNSRRASIVLLQQEHLFPTNRDVVCTYAINFTIEAGHLNMTVMMRSNDVVFGFTNDAFCFWNLMLFVWTILSAKVPDLRMGYYTHITNSMHVYERHYTMLRNIVSKPTGGHYQIDVPRPTPMEVVDLVNSNGKGGEGAYTAWLKA